MHRARRVNVFLNIYELDSFNKYNGYLVPVGLGAYHSGVEIYGEEISFGYHDEDSTGIFIVDPRTATDCTFVESRFVGETELTYAQIKRIVDEMGVEYSGSSYNIFLKNCNHFTTAFIQRLTGQSVPGFVNRLSALGNAFKCFLPFNSKGQMGPEEEVVVVPVSQGVRLGGDDSAMVPLEDDDREQKRALLAAAAAKRVNK